MFLASLTVRGFKSFATTTTLRFEPGITCVVGPNGAGKSNVVDAIAWVLGEQGAKSLRGANMSDVIFAGTPSRPALGRAEVVLTIDNADGALPIDYSEVSISRLLYRSGESEYAINGSACRLLDVQELMSDSGIGRELHVLVGQGQLEAILAARPEDRRSFVEEAAGVLKHRRRKERALRKLEAMTANLARVSDLAAELRRQLGPLGRQAETARRAGTIQAALRDARLRLLADELEARTGELVAAEAGHAELLRDRADAEAELTRARSGERELEGAAAADAPALAAARDSWFGLAGVAERARGLAGLATERRRHLETAAAGEAGGPDPAVLDADAELARSEQAARAEELAGDRERLAAAEGRRRELEAAHVAAERSLLEAERAAADRREGLARLAGDVGAVRSRAEAAEEEVGRLAVALAEARDRVTHAEVELERLRVQAGGADEGEARLVGDHDAASSALAEAEQRAAAAEEVRRAADADVLACQARRDALELAVTRRDGAAALQATGASGLLGTLASLIEVEPGAEGALGAALGPLADALAVDSADAAAEALRILRAANSARVSLLVADGEPTRVDPAGPLPAGGRPAADLAKAPAALAGPLARALAGVVVVADLDAARELLRERPELVAVTTDGDLLARGRAAGGGGSPSLVELTAAAEEAQALLVAARERADAAATAGGRAADELLGPAERVRETAGRLEALDAERSRLAEQLGLATAAGQAAAAELERLERSWGEAVAARDTARGRVLELEHRLADQRAARPTPVPTGTPDELAGDLDAARAGEFEARLAVRSGEERVRALAERADELRTAAAAERARQEQLARRREQRLGGAALAAAVAGAAARLATAAERDLAAAGREHELAVVRARIRDLGERIERLRDNELTAEVGRTEVRMRVEAVENRSAEEYGVPAADLLAEYGPAVPVPPDDPENGEPVPFDRAAQERRAAVAERQLAQLGRINPLALEEYAALEERHAFLSSQVDDLTRGRRDLLGIVREVDERIGEAFRSAFDDTAREFSAVFGMLFPGGEGRLALTDPGDLLTTGIEVHARPAGKRVSRLSLLSGGERSLAAIALLLAIFRARPSPFYVLDEIEAALDDHNLSRLLDTLEELRPTSQLILVTHQKRTMEIADALYGVSMRGGVSTVISQRIRERVTA